MTITWHEIQKIFTSIQNAQNVYTPERSNTLLRKIADIDDSSGSKKLWEILLSAYYILEDELTLNAIFTQNLQIVQQAVKQGQLNLSDKGSNGDTPLHYAIWQLFNATDEKNITALKEVVEVMIDNGADLTLRDNSGYTPLHYAILELAQSKDEKNITALKEVVEVMSNQQGALNVTNNFGNTPLHEVIWRWYHPKDEKNITALNDVIKVIIDNGAALTL